MLEQLLQLVKENAGDAIVNNTAIPDEKNDAAIESATGSIFNSLKLMAGGGNLDSVLGMFKGGSDVANNQTVNNISANVAGDLMKKFGLDQVAASGIVKQLIPTVMNQLVNKTNDPNDKSFDLQDIIGAISGGQKKGGGLMNILKGIFRR